MIYIAWAFVFMTAQGPVIGSVSETVAFNTRSACEEFGDAMTARTMMFVRGAFKLDPNTDIEVAFACRSDGVQA